MHFMGIDQSYTSTGLVVVDNGGTVVKCMTIGSNPDHNEFERTWLIAQSICSVASQYNPQIIAIEGLAFGGRGDATRKLAGLQFVIVSQLMYGCDINYDVRVVAPTTLKKFATGSGKAQKTDMLQSTPDTIKTLFEANFKKTKGLYDVVDAYHLAMHAVKSHKK